MQKPMHFASNLHTQKTMHFALRFIYKMPDTLCYFFICKKRCTLSYVFIYKFILKYLYLTINACTIRAIRSKNKFEFFIENWSNSYYK